MEIIGKLKYVLLAAGILLALMVLKSSENHAWKGKKDQIAEKIITGNCFIRFADLERSTVPVTLLRLGNAEPDSLMIPAAYPVWELTIQDLVSREILKKLKNSSGRYVIVSASRAGGIKAWALLDQLGVQNLYILMEQAGEDEILKYQFRPDPTFRPEPVTTEN